MIFISGFASLINLPVHEEVLTDPPNPRPITTIDITGPPNPRPITTIDIQFQIASYRQHKYPRRSMRKRLPHSIYIYPRNGCYEYLHISAERLLRVFTYIRGIRNVLRRWLKTFFTVIVLLSSGTLFKSLAASAAAGAGDLRSSPSVLSCCVGNSHKQLSQATLTSNRPFLTGRSGQSRLSTARIYVRLLSSSRFSSKKC